MRCHQHLIDLAFHQERSADMETNAPSTVWISGATEGIGLGVARNTPWPDARIINLSRRNHPDYESRYLDLTDHLTIESLTEYWAEHLRQQQNGRAWFFQNAHLKGLHGFTGEVSTDNYVCDIQANMAAPLILAQSFLKAVIESGFKGNAGLILLSSAAARSPFEGQAIYCAAKSAIEMWVRVVRRELIRRARSNIWVTAVRPGFVDTATTRHIAAMTDEEYPAASVIANALDSGEGVFDIDTAGRQIWAALPTTKSLLLFGEQVQAKTSDPSQR